MNRSTTPRTARPRRCRLHLALLIPALAATAGIPVPARASFPTGVIWYTHAADDQRLALASRRFDLGITGRDVSDPARLKALRPDFRWFLYNSATDNYVPPHPGGTPEHDLLLATARERGWDAEEAYLHYFRDTRLVLGGDTLLVPGWTGGSATRPEDARVPVYTPDLTRRAVNFSTPRAAALQRAVLLRLGLEPFEGTDVRPDGIFLDNASARLFNFGDVLSGGEILEAAGHPPIQSAAFQSWQWRENLGPFLASLAETLRSSTDWSPDHRRKALMINVANVWDDSYATLRVADILFMEYQYSPVRNAGPGQVQEAYRRDALAAGAGMASFYPSLPVTAVSGVPGSLSYARALLGNLAWFLVTRTPESIFFEMGSSAPHAAGWDTLTWRGCIDVAEQELGAPVGAPYVLTRGTDPEGHPYAVTARNYEGGLAVVRNRGRWDEGIGPGTAAPVPLPGPLAPVDPDGRTGALVRDVRLRNGEGMFFLGRTPESPPGSK